MITWAAIAPTLIEDAIQYGPAAFAYVEKVYQLWTAGAPPTPADFDALRALLSQTAAMRMKANLIAKGIDPASPQGVALINLAGGTSTA